MRTLTLLAPAQLTDFASARVPKIETCSLSDMTSFSAADIVSKLKVTAHCSGSPSALSWRD